MSYPLPDLGELAAALGAGRRPLAIGGITPGARALVLAALGRCGMAFRRTLVVVPHVAEASDLAAGLRLLAPDLKVGVVPAEGASPYQGAEPPLAARLDLVRLLLELAAGAVGVVVAPARVLASPIPVPERLAGRTIRLRRGDAVDTGRLAGSLAAAGYRRVDLVEEAGEFAVRGWVVDVHAGGDSALRVELDDVAVDRLQAFDPATQRSIGSPLDAVELAPLDPFPAEPEQLAAAAASFAGEHPALAGMMREGVERRLWWGALHLGGEWTSWLDVAEAVLLCDRDEALGELGRWRKVQEREWQTMVDRDVGVPGPERLLADPERVRQRLERAELRIESLELADGTTSWWRLATHPMESFVRRLPDLVPTLRHRRALDLAQVLVVASDGEAKRFRNLLVDGEVEPVPPPPGPGDLAIALSDLERGFRWDGGLAVYGRRDLTAAPSPRRRRAGVAAFVSDLRDLRPGDLVVHMDHGIGRFAGFRRIEVEGRLLEMMVLAYRDDDTLLLPVERRGSVPLAGGVLVDQVGALHRQQQRVVVAVGEDHHLEQTALHLDPAETGEPPDAVVHVHDQVARPEVAEVRHEGGDPGPPAPRRGRGREVPPAVHREPAVPAEAALEVRQGDRDVARTGRRRHRLQLTVDEQVAEPLGLAVGGHHQHLREVEGAPVAQRRHEVRDAADEAVHGVGRQPPPAGRPVGQLQALDAQLGLLKPPADPLGIGQQALRLGDADVAVDHRLPLALLDLAPAPELAQRLVAIAQQHGLGDVEPARPLPGEVEGPPPQPALDALPHHPGKRRVLATKGRGRCSQLLRRRRERIERRQLDGVESAAAAALGGRIEGLDPLDRDVVELDAEGALAPRVDVHHPAADRELAGLLDQVDAPVAGRCQPNGEATRVDGITPPQPDRATGKALRNRDR